MRDPVSNYITHQIQEHSWEYHFNEEALKVEEYLSTEADYEKSRLRIAFEQRILSWFDYKTWFQEQYGCAAIEDHLGLNDILNLSETYQKNKKFYSDYSFLNQDLIALQEWEGHTLFLGLNYNENLKKIPNSIFILCPAHILSQITDINTSASAIDNHWVKTESQHLDYSLQARKYFDGFVTLKIKNKNVELFKMDEDLSKEKIDPKIFNFSLTESNPFSQALITKESQTFELSSINLTILDYATAVVTPLTKGKTVLGFLLGLKTSAVNDDDKSVLEKISQEAS